MDYIDYFDSESKRILYNGIVIYVISLFIFWNLTEILYRCCKLNFQTIYCFLHFITNFVIVLISIPYASTLIYDPLGLDSSYDEYRYIHNTYAILNALHLIHILCLYRKLYFNDFLHHLLTLIFWLQGVYLKHPIYSVLLINNSGIPGGLTYLMLFLSKINKFSGFSEKYYSMLLNVYIRCPLSIIFSTILYCRMVSYETELSNKLCIMFIIFFTMMNGIYYMTTIVESYYRVYYKNYYVQINKQKQE